jgi:DNA-binding NarL/FixJ family response regulator
MTSPPEFRPRVVLADDHPSVLVAFGRLLRPSCEIVASVPDGHAAVEAVGALHPDVLVVDLMMPDLDGLEVCRLVKQTAPDTDVVIVTACDDTEVETVALQDGASAFVPKHSAPTTLERTIQQIVADRKRRDMPRAATSERDVTVAPPRDSTSDPQLPK